MHLTALVIDDEPLARSRLRRLLGQLEVDVLAEGCTGAEAVKLCSELPADLLFIDINMPGKSGLEAAEEISKALERPPAIIFCTAYDEYALRAFDANASDYLLKPVSIEDLEQSIRRAGRISQLQYMNVAENSGKTPSLVIRTQGEIKAVTLAEVLFFQSIDKHVYAQIMHAGECLIDSTLKQLESQYTQYFIRIHRSTLVNRAHLSKLTRREPGKYDLMVQGSDKLLPVSRRHLSRVRKCFAS